MGMHYQQKRRLLRLLIRTVARERQETRDRVIDKSKWQDEETRGRDKRGKRKGQEEMRYFVQNRQDIVYVE
jgi:phage portal protein BeeE